MRRGQRVVHKPKPPTAAAAVKASAAATCPRRWWVWYHRRQLVLIAPLLLFSRLSLPPSHTRQFFHWESRAIEHGATNFGGGFSGSKVRRRWASRLPPLSLPLICLLPCFLPFFCCLVASFLGSLLGCFLPHPHPPSLPPSLPPTPSPRHSSIRRAMQGNGGYGGCDKGSVRNETPEEVQT